MPGRSSGFMIGALLTIPSLDLNKRVEARLRQRGFHEVTSSNSIVLKVLGAEGDRITDLASKAGMTKQSMGYLVAQLEATGFIERATDPRDGRASIIRRTERGWSYNRAAADEVARLEAEWAKLLGPAKMGRLKALLGELVSNLGHEYRGSQAEAASG